MWTRKQSSRSKDTLYRYLEHLEESYIVFTVPVAERSIRKRAMIAKKVHPVHWALGYPFVPERSIDVGRRLAKTGPENAERVLVAHERTGRKPPAGTQVVDALRYLLGEARAQQVAEKANNLKSEVKGEK